MKKILSVSILAVLAVAPLSAKADTAYQSQKSTADASTDGGIAAVSYVKGAYDAAVGVVEMENARATEAETTLGNRIGTVAADGNYIEASSTKNVAENLGLLDTAVKANADKIGAGSIANEGATAGQTNLVGAVNALNTAVGNAGTAATVGAGHHYVGSDILNNQDGQAGTADDNTVANNLIKLDDQVWTNTGAIGTLNGSKSTANSVSYKIDQEAQGAAYTDTTTQLGANTIQGAIGKVDTRLDTLEGDASNANSVLGKIKSNAAGADFETNNTTNTNFDANANTITAAIDQLDTAVYSLKSGGNSVANQIKTQAENADFTNDGTNITANTVAGAITEVSNRKVPVYTTWGTNGAASGTGQVSLVPPTI